MPDAHGGGDVTERIELTEFVLAELRTLHAAVVAAERRRDAFLAAYLAGAGRECDTYDIDDLNLVDGHADITARAVA